MKFLTTAALGTFCFAGVLQATNPITPEKAVNDIKVREYATLTAARYLTAILMQE